MNRIIKSLCTILPLVLVCGMLTVLPAAAEDSVGNTAAKLDEGTHVPHQVLVMFRENAVRESDITLSAARRMEQIGEEFGGTMQSVSESAEAAKDAKSEVAILSSSLGDDFLIEDTISIDDGLTVALVSSEKYDTEAMIEKLSQNPQVASAEPNGISEAQSLYSYSVNDPLSGTCYQANNPQAQNLTGANVSTRGVAPEKTVSTNSGYVSDRFTGEEDEVVVAIIDSGVETEHEDIKEMLWTNPGNIGLAGEHGFNTADNVPELNDWFGHGTHVAGIIGAQANNAKGIAGIASGAGVNVKLMILSTCEQVEGQSSALQFRELGAFNYILKAKQRGVNVVAVNCSWASQKDDSKIYDEIINRLGEEGVISFFAAGNEGVDNDNASYAPVNGDSPYKVVVGAMDIDGKSAGFSNYGKSQVDVFAPGKNILSPVGYPSYFPSIYSGEKRSATTEYYGEVNADTQIVDNQVTLSTGGTDGVKAFGTSVLHKQNALPDSGLPFDENVSYELEVTNDNYLHADNPYTLKLTIHNVDVNASYWLYFPYEKNPATTGSDNTWLSVNVISDYAEGQAGYTLSGGEVTVDENGDCTLTGNGYAFRDPISKMNAGQYFHLAQAGEKTDAERVLSADKLGDKKLGMGICIAPSYTTGDVAVEPGESDDMVIYLESIAVSKPGAAITSKDSYDVMSGTSMATPSATGAYAVYAALHPRQEGQSLSDYALQTRAGYLSCARRTEELNDLCATGGYIDLTKIDEGNPAITDAVCDLDAKTVTLSGIHLSKGNTLKYQLLDDKASGETAIDPADVEFADDGSSVVIKNAAYLFNRFTRFTLYQAGELRASNAFFLVKGQKRPEKLVEQRYTEGYRASEFNTPDYRLLTDGEGDHLYEVDLESGRLAVYKGGQFAEYRSTDLIEAARQYLKKQDIGYSDYELYRCCEVKLQASNAPLAMGDTLYMLADVTYSPYTDAPEDEQKVYHYLASLNFTDEAPAWEFAEIGDVFKESGIAEPSNGTVFTAVNGKIYCILIAHGGETGDDLIKRMYSYDVAAGGKWTKEAEPPVYLEYELICNDGENLYLFFGLEEKQGAGSAASQAVYRFDGESWTQLKDLPYTGKNYADKTAFKASGACTAVGNGIMFLNCTSDGYGNCFLYHPETGECEPMYYSFNDYKADNFANPCAVETRDGVYFMFRDTSDYMPQHELFCIPVSSGAYESSYPQYLIGDVDLDGNLTVLDVTMIQRANAEMIKLDGMQQKLADVDGDGEVTINDATCIQRYLAELKDCGKAGEVYREA